MSKLEDIPMGLGASLDEKNKSSEVEEVQEGKSEPEEDSDSGDSWIVVEEDSDKTVSEDDEDTCEYETDIKDMVEGTFIEEIENKGEEEQPLEELPIPYPQIHKNLNYSHKPNRDLNVFLTASVVLGLAVALGFGFGHFLGWSERIEGLDVNHTASDEEAILIEQLKSENEELRMSINEATLLRNQIQTLILENANLEREIQELRSNRDLINENLASQESIEVLRLMLDQTNSLLKETKENLNDIMSENEILKIEVGKARYRNPTLPVEEREKIKRLITENEELKEEVKNIRLSIPISSGPHDDMPLPKSSCHSKPPKNDDHQSYANMFNDFFKDYSEKTRQYVEEAKHTFESKIKPDLYDMGHKLYNKWEELKDFTQNSNAEEKIEESKKVLNKIGDSLSSFYKDLTLYGYDIFKDYSFSQDASGEKRNSDYGKKEYPSNKMEKNINNWYIVRGKGRKLIRQEKDVEPFDSNASGDKDDWLFRRTSFQKKSQEDSADKRFDIKSMKSKKYFEQKYNSKNWKRQNKRFRGD